MSSGRVLAIAQGIGLPPGSGFYLFQALEAGQRPSSPGWNRGDTIAYLRDPANQSELIDEGRGEDDTIDAGTGIDVVFGQGSSDSLTGGTEADTFVYRMATGSTRSWPPPAIICASSSGNSGFFLPGS